MSSEPTHPPSPPESQWFPNGRWRDQDPAVEFDRRRPQQARFQDRRWLHALLFLATLLTTTLIGALHYAGFATDFLDDAPITPSLVQGFWYSVPILVILGAHEMGHYLACRYYQVDASLPYFIPVPSNFLLTGTLGAFIRIREPIPTKSVLFDNRRRRADRGLRRGGPGALHGAQPVADRDAAARLRRPRAWASRSCSNSPRG